jgi:hypothetical protein
LKGIYRFYQDGELIHEEENLITTLGKAAILRYLAGYTGHFGRSIRLGVGATAANANDLTMNFESVQAPITLISPDYTNTWLVFKARLDDTVSGSFYEAGLANYYTEEGEQFGSALMLTFDNTIENWSAGTYNTAAGPRLGTANLRLAPATSTTTTATLDTFIDMSGYSNTDDLKLAYRNNNANAASVFIRFYTDASNYFTYTVNSPAVNYNIATFNKGNFTATGSPSWGNITQVAVSATAGAGGAASIDFDGFRIDDKDTYNNVETLVSRTVLGTPVTKAAGVPLDVEYTLDLTL